MRIRVNQEMGTITIDGVTIDAKLLREICDPAKRLLYRFVRRGGVIYAVTFDETKCIWMDRVDEPSDELSLPVAEELRGGPDGN